MNRKQLVSMWCGIGIILLVAIVTVLGPYEPDYKLFAFWTFLSILLAVGFINTFRTKKDKLKVSREMNLHKGYRRLVFVLSLIPVLFGIVIFIAGLADEANDMLTGGFLIALIGFVTIWTIYGVVLYVVKGFNANYCDNCEREIGKLEKQFKFNEHVVCAECQKKLNENKKNGIS